MITSKNGIEITNCVGYGNSNNYYFIRVYEVITSLINLSGLIIDINPKESVGPKYYLNEVHIN